MNLQTVRENLRPEAPPAVFRQIYPDAATHGDRVRRFANLVERFAAYFPGHEAGLRLFSAPGRTEVCGNHTDHQHGRVICATIDQDIIAIAAPTDDGIIRLKSEEYENEDLIDLSILEPVDDESDHSASLIRGVAAAFAAWGFRIGGFVAYTTSHVPPGSGLSSSAAFEVLVATIMSELYNEGKVDPVTRARAGQYAENVFFGKPSGLMDQCGSAVGGFMTIDFDNPEEPVIRPLGAPLEQGGLHVVITRAGGTHADLTPDYAAIPVEMRQVAAALGHTVLREVDPDRFYADFARLRTEVGDRAMLRAMHFLAENERVRIAADALEEADLDGFLEQIRASGRSSDMLLQNVWTATSPREQPIAVATALSDHLLNGAGASRVHGGGFAGTMQSFVPDELLADYVTAMEAVFGAGAVLPINVRPLGACAVPLDI